MLFVIFDRAYTGIELALLLDRERLVDVNIGVVSGKGLLVLVLLSQGDGAAWRVHHVCDGVFTGASTLSRHQLLAPMPNRVRRESTDAAIANAFARSAINESAATREQCGINTVVAPLAAQTGCAAARAGGWIRHGVARYGRSDGRIEFP